MAVTEVRELIERGGSSEGFPKLRAKRTFRVRVDSPSDDMVSIYASGLLPAFLAPHPSNLFLTARGAAIEQEADKHWQWWKATIDYSAEPLKSDDKEKNDQPNPLLRAAKIRWRTNAYERIAEKDKDGNACVNSAGDYFDPPLMRDANRWTVEVAKNVAAVPSWIADVDSPINDASFAIGGLTIAAGKARIQSIEIGELQEENGAAYYAFSFALEFRREGWALSALDQGYHYLDGSTRKRAQVDGQDSANPVLLDGSGGILPNPEDPTNAVFLDFDVHDELDFSLLPLT
jgi:hypothetical protein